MSVHGISAVRLDDRSGHVVRVRWARLNGTSDHYQGDAHDADVVDVVKAIEHGETVFLVFRAEGQNLRGPQVIVENGRAGHKHLATAATVARRGIRDLPRF